MSPYPIDNAAFPMLPSRKRSNDPIDVSLDLNGAPNNA